MPNPDSEHVRPTRTPSRLRSFFIRIRRAEALFVIAIAALVAVTGAAAWANVAKSGWSSDAAAWAQAAGSILAIAGAAWLARSEARQARRFRREQGEEAAWAVRFVISQAQFDSQIVAAELTRNDGTISSDELRSWRQRAANSALALTTILTRADHIHAAVVLTACNAKVLVDSLETDLAKLDEIFMRDGEATDELIGDIVYAHLNLQALIEQYDARVRGIRLALDRGNDMLPIDERPEWSITPRP